MAERIGRWRGGLRRADREDSPGDEKAKPRESKPRHKTWQVQRAGPDARAQAIADLAAQILVDTGKSTLTHNWRSFRSFHEAIKLRQRQDSRPGADDLTAARDHLEQAVIHDPSNWIARFNLALTLCRRQSGAHSAEALRAAGVRDRARLAGYRCTLARRARDGRHSRTSSTTFRRYPECAFLILYNKAVALATLDAWIREMRRAFDSRRHRPVA